MITLLRHLTPLFPPHSGYDELPKTTETTPGADLTRIKYYRNYLAHLDDGKIYTAFFNTAWTNITGVCKTIRFSEDTIEITYGRKCLFKIILP